MILWLGLLTGHKTFSIILLSHLSLRYENSVAINFLCIVAPVEYEEPIWPTKLFVFSENSHQSGPNNVEVGHATSRKLTCVHFMLCVHWRYFQLLLYVWLHMSILQHMRLVRCFLLITFVFMCEIKQYKICSSYLGNYVGSMYQYQLTKLTKDRKHVFEKMGEIRGVLKL